MLRETFEENFRKGLQGKNKGIPIGLERLNKYVALRKRLYTVVFGPVGSGKSAFVHNTYILNPIENSKDKKLKIIFFSMERSISYVLAKWLSRKIFLEEGLVITVPEILGWTETSKENIHKVEEYMPYLESLEKHIIMIEGPQNPTGIYKVVKEYAAKNGKFEKISDYKTIYHPNDEDETVIVVIDHIGLTKKEVNLATKKEAIDKVSEHCQYFRDVLGYKIVVVSQLNRNLSNPIFQKIDSFEPTIDDIKESGRLGEDADIVMSIFEPIRYRTEDAHYDVYAFVDKKTGAKHFRSLKVHKNTYGEDDVKIGLAFMGVNGYFKELPAPNKMDNFDYEKLFDYSFYL